MNDLAAIIIGGVIGLAVSVPVALLIVALLRQGQWITELFRMRQSHGRH